MKQKSAFIIPYFLTVCAMAQPQARHLERIAFDSYRNKVIMYGGAANVNNRLIYFSDVHEWDEAGWHDINAPGPGGRNASPLVYDPLHKISFLFGGTYEDHEGFRIYFDVWRWDGMQWKLVNSDCPVKDPDAVYDPVANRILVYGEITNKKAGEYGSDRRYELWEFKSGKWKKLSDDGPDVYPIMAFDEARNTLVIPSLEEDSAMWEWSAGNWKRITCKESCPINRSRQAMAYLPGGKAIYMFGGRDSSRQYLNDFWKWDGEQWTEIISHEGPAQRASARMVNANDKLILYGGALKGGVLSNEIWIWGDNKWRAIDGFTQLSPAHSEKLRALDFLIGEWKISVDARLSKDGPWEKSEARSSIRRVVGNTILEEDLKGTRHGREFIARRWIANDNRTLRYQWAFVDSDHGVLELYEGNMENGTISLKKEIITPQGTILRRLVYSDLTPNSFKIQSLRSADMGQTWDVTGSSLYERIGK